MKLTFLNCQCPVEIGLWEGTYYRRLDYDIILLFNLTELEAVAAWKENMGPLLV